MVNPTLESKAGCFEKWARCRLCLTYREFSFNIFSSNETSGIDLWSVLRDLIRLEVAEGDGLPDTVCGPCSRKLMEFKEFTKMCYESDSVLKSNILVSGIKNEPMDAVPNGETPTKKVICRGELIGQDESKVRAMRGVVIKSLETRNLNDVKDMAVSRVLLAEEETNGGENLYQYESREGSMNDMVNVPMENGDLEHDSCVTQSILKAHNSESSNLAVKMPGNIPVKVRRKFKEILQAPSLFLNSNSDGHRRQTESIGVVQEESLVAENCDVGTDIVDVMCTKERRDDHKLAEFENNRPNDRSEYICNECGFKCSDKTELSAHIFKKTLLNERPEENTLQEDIPVKCKNELECEVCGKVFRRRCVLFSHSMVHLDLERYDCKICGIKFKYKSGLSKHRRILHSRKEMLLCELCGMEFQSKNSLLKHSRILHGMKKQIVCEICGMEFKGKRGLWSHLRKHVRMKQLMTCETCGKMCRGKTALARHSLIHSSIHSNMKPFQCETCGQGFSDKSCLGRHSIIHRGLKPFTCFTCGKKFSDKSSLRRHSYKHSSVKPFKCAVCGKEYVRKLNMVSHISTHSGF